jgi:large subunit ribosomal protein L10e
MSWAIPRKEFKYTINVVSKGDLQIRHNAIESARQSANRVLEKNLGKNGYFFRINIYPHHILRENPLAAGAGADRMSTGMKMSFGKAIGVAAQVKKGQNLFTFGVEKGGLEFGKQAAKRVIHKVPTSCSIVVQEN